MTASDQLDRVKAKFDYIHTIRKLNNNQPPFRIPKYLFIKHILTFLEDEDITSFGVTCKIANSMIYNSFAFRVLLATRGMKATAQAMSFQSFQSNQALQRDLESLNSKDVRAQLSAFTTLKDFLTDKTKVLEDMFDNSQKEVDQFKKDILNERRHKHMNLETVHALEQQYKDKDEAYKIEKRENVETVKELNKQYTGMIKKKEQEYQEMEETKQGIISEKETIIEEINRLKEETQKRMAVNDEYKEVLNKMQQVFNMGILVKNQGQLQMQKQGSSPYFGERSGF